MGYYDGSDCDAAQDRAWGRDGNSLAQLHADAAAVLAEMADPFLGSDHVDELVNGEVDDSSDLREFVALVLRGKAAAAAEQYAAAIRVKAAQRAFRLAREAA